MAGTTSTNSFPEHAVLYIYYVADDSHSHYTVQKYSQTLIALDPTVSRNEFLRSLLSGGSPSNPPSWSDNVAIAAVLCVLTVIDATTRMPWAVVMLFTIVTFYVLRFVHHHGCRRWRTLLLASITSTYLFAIVVNFFFIPEHVWIANRSDAALLSARMKQDDHGLAVKALLLVLSGSLVLATVRVCLLEKQVGQAYVPGDGKALI